MTILEKRPDIKHFLAEVAVGDEKPERRGVGWVAICYSIPDCREGWIPDSRGWIPDSKDKNMLDSGFSYMGRLKNSNNGIAEDCTERHLT